MKKALVTMAIGSTWSDLFDRTFRESFQIFADKYNYELVILSKPLEYQGQVSTRPISWHRLLIPKLLIDYDAVLFMDADIAISPFAKDPADGFDFTQKKVGACLTPREGIGYDRYMLAPETLDEYYEKHGRIRNAGVNGLINGGVLLYNPKLIVDDFERIFNFESVNTESQWEQPALSYYILKNGLFHDLGETFNKSWQMFLRSYYPFLFSPRNKSLLERVYYKLRSIALEPIYLTVLLNSFYLADFMHFHGDRRSVMILASHKDWYRRVQEKKI